MTKRRNFATCPQDVEESAFKAPVRPHCKNIRRFYGKITGNQLPVYFLLFLQAPVNIFRNQAKDIIVFFFVCLFFLSYSPTILQRYFRALSVNITLPYLDF